MYFGVSDMVSEVGSRQEFSKDVQDCLTLLHSERVLAFLSAIGLIHNSLFTQ